MLPSIVAILVLCTRVSRALRLASTDVLPVEAVAEDERPAGTPPTRPMMNAAATPSDAQRRRRFDDATIHAERQQAPRATCRVLVARRCARLGEDVAPDVAGRATASTSSASAVITDRVPPEPAQRLAHATCAATRACRRDRARRAA